MDEVAEIKNRFIRQLREFTKQLSGHAQTAEGQWAVKGFIDVFKNVYTISGDTKIISKILEIHLLPLLLKFAQKNRYKVVLAEHQNWYPDLSFIHEDDPEIKFAVDIKTTYRDPEYPDHCKGFTLGSHGEYFVNRDSTKNIQFPYGEYLAHIVLGIIYTRAEKSTIDDTKIFRIKELGDGESIPKVIGRKSVHELNTLTSIPSVIQDLLFFVREKWEIASDSSGSGNTANIGSITKIEDILNGNGVFKNLGEEWFDEYWMNYGKITIKASTGKVKTITKLTEYLEYRGKDPALANPKARRSKKKQ
ncbi:MAG: restriction endonuclease [Calditrichaeota bacterium]|nr:MAG: restriction endonuclease [Calditrichota bacterium]